MRRVSPPKGAMVKRNKGANPVQQPVPPIGGFPTINRTAFLRGMARKAGMLKGDPSPNIKLKAPKAMKGKKLTAKIGATAPSSTPGVMSTGGNMTRGGKGPGR